MAHALTDGLAMSPEQTEQVRILGQLAGVDQPTQNVKQDSVLRRTPDWKNLVASGMMQKDVADCLSGISPSNLEALGETIEQSPSFAEGLLASLQISPDAQHSQYLLALLYELMRENACYYESFHHVLTPEQIFGAFIQILTKQGVDSYAVDCASFLLTGCMSRGADGSYSPEQVEYVADLLMRGKQSGNCMVSEIGRLEAFANLLKRDSYRQIIWNVRGVPELILKLLSLTQSAGVIYKVVFCVWLMSFQEHFLVNLNEQGFVRSIAQIIRGSRVEKVARVCVAVILNFLKCEPAVEIIIEENLMQSLTLLEFEKWRDLDMYEEIRQCVYQLDQKVRQFNSFDRYCMELDKGRFTWSVLHSEKFWHENVMAFEVDQFHNVERIVYLLDNSDPVTQAVACHDLGEFARLHPAGKKVCEKFKVKDKVMLLISDKDRRVAGEALLCVQKLMLDNWQDIAKGKLL